VGGDSCVSYGISKKHLKKRRRSEPIRFRNRFTNAVELLEQVSSYKYLGVLIDDNLKFDKWCERIVTPIINRTSMIRRISASVQLGRDLIEKFYQGYVRGFINYGSSTWQCLPESLIEKIEIADRKGMRLCCGALLRTKTTDLQTESKIIATGIKNQLLLCISPEIICII
jgi:hypothetical protein